MTLQKKYIAFLVVMVLVAGIATSVYLALRPTSYRQQAAVQLPNAIYAEAPERAFGPDSRLYDGPFTTSINSGELKAYLNSMGKTWLMTGTSLDTLTDTGQIILNAGNSFDNGGAWLMSPSYYSQVLGKTVGWYHAEKRNGPPLPIKSIAYVESSDNGSSFVKAGYDGNQVITADTQFRNDSTNEKNQTGDFKVIPFPINNPQYYYMYFQATRDSDTPDQSSWTIHLARSEIASGGKPGTWYKLYHGQFSEPGLGGKSNSLAVEGGRELSRSWVSFNRDINKYLGLSDYWDQEAQTVTGTILNYSSDGIHFQPLNSSPFTLLDSINQSYYYASLIGLDGNPNEFGNTFYLYRSYIIPGSDARNLRCTSDNCYTARYKITLKNDTNAGSINGLNKIKFNKYQSSDGGDDWDTTGAVFYANKKYGTDYIFRQDLGYLLTTAASGSEVLYSCYNSGWKDHMLVNSPDGCDGVNYIEKIGYTVSQNTPGAKAIYRCYNNSATNHYVSLTSDCDGKPQDFEFLLGYSFFPDSVVIPTNTPRPPTRTPTPSPSRTPTPTPPPSGSPTPSPTRGATPTTTPFPTNTPVPGNTILSLTLSLQGIESSTATTGANTTPINQQRDVLVQVYNANNQQVGSDLSGTVSYDALTGLFTGNVDALNLQTSVYSIKVKTDRYLRKLIPGIQTVQSGKSNNLPSTTLTLGDINGDNLIDIQDYNMLSSCFGVKQETPSCLAPDTADLDDNGRVDGIDYNYLIRNMSVQAGD